MTDAPAAPPESRHAAAPRHRWSRWTAIGLAGLVVLLLALLVGARLALRTDGGRAEVLRLANGLQIGPYGTLRLEGLRGDVLSDFTVARATVSDARGVWAEGRDLSLRWRWTELFARRFHAERIGAGLIRVARAPVVKPEPPSKPKPLPVSIRIDQVRLMLETLPALSVQRGVYDIDSQAEIARDGAARGRLDARSRLHRGDGVAAVFSFGGGRPVTLHADAVEAQGGALAGLLGLPADRRLQAKALASSTPEGVGRLTLDTVSGDIHPLRAQADWTKAGARLDATALLAASRLTAAYAGKLGPQAHLVADARRDRGDLYGLKAALTAQFASVRVDGPVDSKRKSTPGLKLDIAVADLTKWAAQPAIGPLQTSGTLAGDPDRFKYAARLTADRVSQSGYTLARVAGPATVIRNGKEWRVQADLAGAGGRGQGLTFALLGGAPTARLDASLLADGRFLIRELKATGAGLRVDASGGQGLLGGLSFKGSAALSNLAVAQKGARGVLNAAWSAGQPKNAKAWDLTADIRGAGLASGIAEADRLLGPTPRLVAKGSVGPAGVQLGQADLTGAKAQVSARGALDARQMLGFDLTWRADGPFAAGPVEIAGQARGSGRISGALAAPRADLKADFASIDFGPKLVVTPAHLDLALAKTAQGFDGTVALNGPSRYGPATARTGFRFAGGGIDLHDLYADAGGVKLQGSAALRDGAPSSADLTVAAGPGAFLARGRLTGAVKLIDRAGTQTAGLRLEGLNLAAPDVNGSVKSLRLTADGPLSRLPFQLAAETVDPVPARLNGAGVFSRVGEVNQVTVQASGRVRKVDFRTVEAAVIRIAPKDLGARLRLQVAGGTASVDASQTGEALSARATVAGVSLAALQEDFAGRVNATLALNGRGPRLDGTVDATLDGARSRDAPENLALAARVRAVLGGARLRVDANATNAQGLKAAVNLDLPAEAAAQPFRIAIDKTKPLRGGFSADGELRPLWDLLVGGDQTVSGKLAARGTVGGTLNKPQASGQATLAGGKVTDSGTGLNLQNLTVSAAFDQGAVNVRQFSGVDGHGGLISGDGRIGLAVGSGSTFALKLTRFQLIDNDAARATASGAVTVNRDAKGLAKLEGQLVVDRADVFPTPSTGVSVLSMDVVEIHKKGGDETAAAKPKAPSAGAAAVSLDVTIKAPRRIYIRGRGLDLELSLDAHVGGSSARPDLSGEARVVRGSYDFAGKRFDFDESGVVRLGATPETIRLSLLATRVDSTLTATVRVAGTAARPEVTLSSVPVLPQDEILSQVLFGRSAAQLSAAEAAQLGVALASLSGGKGLDLIGGLRQFARLDRLAIGGDQTSGTTVSGGKYITDNIYVQITGGGRTGPSAQVEYQVRRNLSLVSSLGSRGDTRLSIRFRRNFK